MSRENRLYNEREEQLYQSKLKGVTHTAGKASWMASIKQTTAARQADSRRDL